MLFRKKKRRKPKKSDGMIDIGKLHQKGRVLGPERESPDLTTDKDGFAIVGSDVSKTEDTTGSDTSFMDTRDSSSGNSFSTESSGYSKREVDARVQELDRMVYKLEQRVEVLEKKAGVDPGVPPSNPNSGIIGW